jgi:hypothetical protein
MKEFLWVNSSIIVGVVWAELAIIVWGRGAKVQNKKKNLGEAYSYFKKIS